MDQKLEGTPKATLTIAGRTITRSDITNDWGTRLQWKISRDGKEVATLAAGIDPMLEISDTTPGKYQVVLQQFHYVNYKKSPDGNFIDSKYIDISEPVSYAV